MLEISAWDNRTITVSFSTEKDAHAHAERLIAVQMEMLRVVDNARRAGQDFSVT